MAKNKIDLVKLNELLRSGKSPKEVAQFFQVSDVAVWKARKRLKSAVVKNVVLESGHRVLEGHLDAVSQLQKINERTNAILDGLMEEIARGGAARERQKDLREIALKASQEIRGQLSLQLEIMRTLYDVTSIAEFQKTVIEEIGACEPEVRSRIIERLKRARALRASVQY